MNLFLPFDSSISEAIVERLGWVLVHSLWQFALMALLAGATVRALRRSSAMARYGVLVAAMAVSVVVPVVTWMLQPGDATGRSTIRNVTISEHEQESNAVTGQSTAALTNQRGPILSESVPATPLAGTLGLAGGIDALGPSSEVGASRTASETPSAVSPLAAFEDQLPPSWSERAKAAMRPWLAWIVAAWGMGVLLCSARPLLGWHMLRRLQRVGVSPVSAEVLDAMRRVSARLGLRRAVRIMQSTLAQVPVVVGYMRPVVLLPVSLVTTIPAAQLEAILAHELAHVRRHDFVVNLLQTLFETLFFYHPAVWWLSRQIRVEREHCCDDLVVALLGNRVEYGRALVAIEQLRGQNTVLALGATDGSLLARVRRIAGLNPDRAAGSPWSAVSLITCCVGVLFVLSVCSWPANDTVSATEGNLESARDLPKEDDSAQTGNSQILSWSMLVDGTLAEAVTKLDRDELPRQGAFRVLQCDATKLRKALFDQAAKAHVFADVQAPEVLPLSASAGDWRDKSGLLTFRIHHQSGATSFAHGQVGGRYLSFPGAPFELKTQTFSIDIDASVHQAPSQHQIKPQSLAFRGDVPIGSALAFIGKAEAMAGKQDFHVILIYEAVPTVTEQAKRLLADMAWFKAGPTRATAVLQQAEAFNSKAAALPDELPERWTKRLPHGGSVSLVAIARPQTHPFCWWDADGQPRSADWTLQQHALGQVAMLALVCIRDPAAGELERQGVAYTMIENSGPLPLYQPWKDLVDSELYLFSVYNTDSEQRPVIGVYTGDGPWTELGKLKPKEEVTYGRADYLLGEPPLGPDSEAHLILGRRYLPDEEVRLQLIDKQGKVWPVRPNWFRTGISDTQEVPAQWDGWSEYNAKVVVREIDQYVLESRARYWSEFVGFASELDAAKEDDLPKIKAARPAAPTASILTAQLTDKLDAWLQSMYGNIFREEDRDAIVEDFRRFVDRHKPAALTPERSTLISRGFDGALSSLQGDYLGFFSYYTNLKWRLWLAFRQRALSPDEQARREQQRNEWRKLIRAIPITHFHIVRTHGHAIAQLDKLMESPWHGWFHEPLTDEEFARFQQELKHWTINDPIHAHAHFDTIVMRVKANSMPNDGTFGTGPLPLDAEVIANLKSKLLKFHTRYADQSAFNGLRDIVFDQAPQSGRRILDFSRTIVEVPRSVPLGLEAVQEWAAEKRVGLLAYESARHGLFMLRGAKLGVLPVSTWHEADRLTDDELFRIVSDQARDSILLADHYGPRPETTGYGAPPPGPLLVVESATGELGVVRVEAVSHDGIDAHLRARPNAVKVAAKFGAADVGEPGGSHRMYEIVARLRELVAHCVTDADREFANQQFRTATEQAKLPVHDPVRPFDERRLTKPVRTGEFALVKEAAFPLIGELHSLEQLFISASDLRGQLSDLAQLHQLRKLRVVNSQFEFDELRLLNQYPLLESIDVMLTVYDATDDALASQLGELSSDEQQLLDSYFAIQPRTRPNQRHIHTTLLTDRALRELASLKNLKVLRLVNTTASGRGLASLGNLAKIEELDVGCMMFDVAAAKSFRELSSLRSLRSVDISEGVLAELANLPNLEELSVWGRHVTDADVRHLSRSKKLRRLTMRGTKITDEGLDALSEIPDLAYLELIYGAKNVTASALGRFRERHPDCKLVLSEKDEAKTPAAASVGSPSDERDGANGNAKQDASRESDALEPIVGEVVDAVTGKPLDGATVRFRFRKIQRKPDETDEPVAELVFQNVGRFIFKLPDGIDPRAELFVECTAEHPDFQSLSPAGQFLPTVLKGEPTHVRDFIRKVELSPGKVVTGQILDLNGRPAVGVPVESGRNRQGWQNGCVHKTATDADGRYRLVVPADHGRGRIYVIPNHASAVSRAISTDFGEQPVFKLLRGTRLSGSVNDVTGRGIAGVVVQANGGERVPWRYAVTDAQGRYSLPPCQYGKYVVELVDEGRIPERPKAGSRLPDVFLPQTVELSKKAPTEQVLDFKPTESVRVTARYMTSDDKPVTGSGLTLHGSVDKATWRGSFREVSDESGLYDLQVPRGLLGYFDYRDYKGNFLRIVRDPTDGIPVHQGYVTRFDQDGLSFTVHRYKAASVTVRPVFDGKPVKITGPQWFPQFADDNAAEKSGAQLASTQFTELETGERRFDVHPDIDILLKLAVPGFQPWQEIVQVHQGEVRVIDVSLVSLAAPGVPSNANGQLDKTRATSGDDVRRERTDGKPVVETRPVPPEDAKQAIDQILEVSRAARQGPRSAIGSGTFEQWEQRLGEKEPMQMTQGRIQAYYENGKYHLRLAHKKLLWHIRDLPNGVHASRRQGEHDVFRNENDEVVEVPERIGDGKPERAVIVHDGKAIESFEKSARIRPLGYKFRDWNDLYTAGVTFGLGVRDPVLLGPACFDLEQVVKNIGADSIAISRLPKGGYRGMYRFKDAPKSRVEFDAVPESGFNVVAERAYNDERDPPAQVTEATWKKIDGQWVVTRLSCELGVKGKQHYHKDVIEYESFEVNPPVDPAAFTRDSMIDDDWKPLAATDGDEPNSTREEQTDDDTRGHTSDTPQKGLEFLARYPKLHALSFSMTEPQFLGIAESQKLKPQKSSDGSRTHYRIPTGDGHTVIVMFGNNSGKCSGIQRVRDEESDQPANGDPKLAEVQDEIPAAEREKADEPKKRVEPSFVLPDHWNVMAVGFDPSGRNLVSVSTDREVAIRTWDVGEKKLVHESKLASDKHGNRFLTSHLTLSADRTRVIATEDGEVGIWETATGNLVKKLTLPNNVQPSGIGGLDCSSDLSLIACGLSPGKKDFNPLDAHAIVWDVASGSVLQIVTHAGAVQVHCVALSPDGNWLATGGQQAGTCVWEVSTGKVLLEIPNANLDRKHPDPEVLESGANQVLSLRFSPDGRQLAIGDMLGVKLVDARSGELLHRFDAPFRLGYSRLVFSRNGLLLARIDTDKVVKIWSTNAGKLVAEIRTEAHDGSFSDDGQWFAVGFTDEKNGLAVWRLQVDLAATGRGAPPGQERSPQPLRNPQDEDVKKSVVDGKRATQEQIAEIVRPLLPSIVLVIRTNPKTGRPEPNPNWQAGVVVDKRGYILTTSPRDELVRVPIAVRLSNQSEYPAELVATDPRLQLAVLRIRARWPLDAMALSEIQVPKVGDTVIEVPSPAQKVATTGVVSAVGRNPPTLPPNSLESDLPLPLGEAGSLMVTEKGEPAGIWWGIRAAKVRTSFAVPLQDVLPFLAKVLPPPETDKPETKSAESKADEPAAPISPQKPVEKALPKGVEFLAPYPKLHGLSVDMTEQQFLAIVENQKLKPRKIAGNGGVHYRISTGDGHTVIVMFGDKGKCSGIQRVRGEGLPAQPVNGDGEANANSRPDDRPEGNPRLGTLTGRFVFDGEPPIPKDLRPGYSAIDADQPQRANSDGQLSGVESTYREFLKHNIRPKTLQTDDQVRRERPRFDQVEVRILRDQTATAGIEIRYGSGRLTSDENFGNIGVIFQAISLCPLSGRANCI